MSEVKERRHLRKKIIQSIIKRFIQNCSSISLFIVDPKIISKVLSKKLKTVLADFPESLPSKRRILKTDILLKAGD